MNNGTTNLNKIKFDHRELFKPYVKNWKWFVLFVILALSLGFLKVRYAVPEYAVQAKIQILDEQSTASELDVFKDLNLFGEGKTNVLNELEILKSRSNLINLVRQLGLNITVYELGQIKHTEIYTNRPFNINFQAPDSTINRSQAEFYITFSSETTFEFSEHEDEPFKLQSYGKAIKTEVGDIIITPNIKNINDFKSKKYKIAIQPVSGKAEHYQESILVTPSDDKSNIITIQLSDAIKQRGRDVINTLLLNYNKNDVADRKAIADRTTEFINDRIADIYGSLSSVDQSAEEFKSDRGVVDIASQTNINLNVGAANQQELRNAAVQLDIAASMKDIVDNDEGYELLPSNIGLADASIAMTTSRYNELALERKRLLESSNDKNPIIVNLDQQLGDLKRSMQSSLGGMTNNLTLQVNSLSSQMSKINSRIYSAPRNERALRDITRKQQTTESLYLYLLQKREESQITFASASPKSKVIDSAYLVSDAPVSPKISLIYLASLILGLLVPFGFIYAQDLLDNKVQNKVGLEKLVGNIPVLAELPEVKKKEYFLVQSNDRSVLSEAMRILRTNLDYILKTIKGLNGGSIVFVTSSVPGEGKTFIASNLAMIFASTNKKVLLIGADIRNPKLYTFYSKSKHIDQLGKNVKREKNIGLTEYLFDDDIDVSDVIKPMLVFENTIDVIYSGKIPPNPAELLLSDKLEDLFATVKEKYDYIIVDTAPMLVVTDTLVISKYADHIVYVTKAGMTENKVLNFPISLRNEKKLGSLSFIVNGVKGSNLGYGGKYGYGYGQTAKKWWKFNS